MTYHNRGFCTLSLPKTILSVCSHSQVHKKSALPSGDLLVYDLGVTYPIFISDFRKPVAMVEGHTKTTHSCRTEKLEVKKIAQTDEVEIKKPVADNNYFSVLADYASTDQEMVCSMNNAEVK